jgi:hypothetical protein
VPQNCSGFCSGLDQNTVVCLILDGHGQLDNANNIDELTTSGQSQLQSHQIQVLVGETSWRFKSSHPHQ